jgi:hypothetical protein
MNPKIPIFCPDNRRLQSQTKGEAVPSSGNLTRQGTEQAGGGRIEGLESPKLHWTLFTKIKNKRYFFVKQAM